jgi:hypothetical protein
MFCVSVALTRSLLAEDEFEVSSQVINWEEGGERLNPESSGDNLSALSVASWQRLLEPPDFVVQIK